MSDDSEKIAGMAIMSMARDIDEKDAEIERLRGLLGDVQIIMDSHNNIVGNLNGEITRLRGLLREGLDHHDEYNWQQRVREALGE